MKDNRMADFERALDQLVFPTITTPLHKERLRVVLMQTLATGVLVQPSPLTILWLAFLARLRRHAYYIAVPAMLFFFAVFFWQAFLGEVPTLAYVTIQANPALQLTIDRRGRVKELVPLTAQSALLFTPTDFRQSLATEAMSEIVSRLHREGFLQESAQLALLLHSDQYMGTPRFERLAFSLQQAADATLARVTEGTSLTSYIVTSSFSARSRGVGLLPLDVTALLEAEIEEEMIFSLFDLKEELALDNLAFRARFPAMANEFAKAWRKQRPREELLELGRRLLEKQEERKEEEEEDLSPRGSNVHGPSSDRSPLQGDEQPSPENRRRDYERGRGSRDTRVDNEEHGDADDRRLNQDAYGSNGQDD